MGESRVAWSSLLGGNEAGEYTSVSGRARSLKVQPTGNGEKLSGVVFLAWWE